MSSAVWNALREWGQMGVGMRTSWEGWQGDKTRRSLNIPYPRGKGVGGEAQCDLALPSELKELISSCSRLSTC